MIFDVAAWSLTDVVSNTALFVPFGLFVAAALDRTTRARLAAPLAVLASLWISVTLELAQAYVVWRAPSLLDVAAATVGGALGLMMWRVFRRDIEALAAVIKRQWDSSNYVGRGLLIYLGLFACAWLAPFDVTIRPHEIKDKYEHQRLLLLPSSNSPDAASDLRLALTFAAAIPWGLAVRICGRQLGATRSLGYATALAVLGLVALEVAQMPVFSRNTDVTELIAAVPGAMLGAVAASVVRT